MITTENFKYYFDNLSKEQINDSFDNLGDLLCICIGSYGYCYLQLLNDKNQVKQIETANNTGGFICDKDDFLRLFQESESLNPWLIDLL